MGGLRASLTAEAILETKDGPEDIDAHRCPEEITGPPGAEAARSYVSRKFSRPSPCGEVAYSRWPEGGHTTWPPRVNTLIISLSYSAYDVRQRGARPNAAKAKPF
jgi:hypothetical protein